MSKFDRLCKMIIWIYIIVIILVAILIATNVNAQNVVQRGNTFVQISDSSNKMKKDNPLLTKYFYITADGEKYPIYLSTSGKCFIIRKSKKTGKEYKQYLPEVSKKLYEKK